MKHTLVSTDWLHQHLNDPKLRVVDIRGYVLPASEPPPHYFNRHDDYVKSHLPGAVFVDWVLEITDPDDPRHAQIAKPERYAAAMSRAGIDADTLVVAYDDEKSMFAARLWWSLNYYGHENVAVLDGGWQKWLAEGRPVTADVPSVTPAQFVARPIPALRSTADEVLAKIGTPTKLLDMRSAEEYEGLYSRTRTKGHIPGAISQPRRELLNDDGTVQTREQLRAHFAKLGITDSTEVITYCNGGVSASFGMLALHVAGLTHNHMYDGSWKEWSSDPSKPIVTGA